jgi:twitching motility protein PilU
MDTRALINEFVSRGATDLYLTAGAPPSMRFGDKIEPMGKEKLLEADIRAVLAVLVPQEVIEEFDSTLEYNTAVHWENRARFRINMFRQRQQTGIVMRRIASVIPTIAELNLPKIYANLIMEKRGLIIIVGPTGAGKSTSLAAMLEHRNVHGSGHIVTIEDPIEYIIEHKKCIVTQRDVGIDTYSFGIGLKNTLRQTPDVIVIGEIRDRETMEHAIVFAETGHLCLATLHANNANQAIERIINFFPEEKHKQVLLNLSINLKAILSQRLLPNVEGKRSVALEVMLNHGLIKNLIQEGRIKEIKEMMERGRDEGMQTFEQALMDLFLAGSITEATALAECDNPANMRLALKQLEMSRSPMEMPTGLGIINKQQF